ncbi:ImpA family type VI secretion system protein [Porphyrobacter sp. AAP60]|uniref:type VI secretion system protein TssA n=1 Tax=Porphyrobacter sp. AAP60 TaxID=1523423 RepID=UPI0006B99C8D|nr:type VI secretion system ImpA family N-terminal domain-containing protein [Porphyrobacter sp. AAP60]KPF63518.1 hypothetical protein IP79_06160 [Porphyrobacter sp. AAP60]
MKTIEELLAPVSDEQPCGEDLDESLEFDTLRAAFDEDFALDTGMASLADGEKRLAPVNWSDTFDNIEELCGQTKDLYLAVSYARCGIVRGDPEIVDQGLQFAARLLEEHWDTVYPLVDDPGGRLRGPLFEDLARRGAFAMPFLGMPLILGNRGSIKAEQLLDVHENGGASDSYPAVRGTLDQLDDEAKGAIAAQLASMLDSLTRIEAVLREQGVSGRPDFSTLRDTISLVEEAYLALAGLAVPEAEDGEGDGDDEAGDTESAGPGGPAFGGAVKSRDDVMKALNAIEQYYARAEPGHPMRLAMGRMRSWVNKDFMEILEDIAPRSLDDVKSVLLERSDVE